MALKRKANAGQSGSAGNNLGFRRERYIALDIDIVRPLVLWGSTEVDLII